MKNILFAFLLPFLFPGSWLNDFNQAKELSKEKQLAILLNFSGSDWCSGCIKMRKNIFESDAFQSYAREHLVLLNADFPRNKKNSLPPDQQKKNEALADRYNPEGKFPCTLLLDSNGTILGKWSGYYAGGTEKFIKELEQKDVYRNH